MLLRIIFNKIFNRQFQIITIIKLSINKSLSLLNAWFRLTYATIFGIAILNSIFVLLLSKDTDYLSLIKINKTLIYLLNLK
jgi:hypothetical protein